jgi:hypothetical protein
VEREQCSVVELLHRLTMRSQITFAIGKVTRRNETNEAIAANERTATLKIGGSESGCSEATNEIGCNDTLQNSTNGAQYRDPS